MKTTIKQIRPNKEPLVVKIEITWVDDLLLDNDHHDLIIGYEPKYRVK
jgi:hypothetical protein